MKLKDISRTATFAWDPSSASEPLLASGAIAGALDESFSNDSQLEIWAPKLYEPEGNADAQGYALGGQGPGPKGSVTVASRFNRLAWSQPEAGAGGRGVIAAGLETGEVCLYDPVKIFDNEEALIYKNDKHTGPVRGLHWNPIKKNLLLSGAVNAELYIHDLNNLGSPIPPGPISTKLGEITSLAWNPSVSSVFAASSSSGFSSIWDLRHSKEIAALQYGGGAAKGDLSSGRAGTQIGKRRGMSDLCWHPEQATRLVTASEDDESPIVMLWDLRNTRAPERILTGHTKGVLSVAWCRQDSDLLASCGKDNRTLLWNPQTGDIVGELAPTSDWAFETAWCPSNPNLLAVASFDGHIGINSLQSTGPKEAEENKLAADATTDDIFASLSSATASDDKTDAKSLTQAPKWMQRPASASWGYGGLLTTVSNLPGASGKNQSSVVHLRHVVTEESILERAKALDEIAGNKEKLAEFSNSKSENPSWKAIQSLFQANSRDEIVSLLGFSKAEVASQVEELVKKLVPTVVEPEVTKGDQTPKSEEPEATPEGEVEKTPEAKTSINPLFSGDDRPVTPADVGGDTDFFSSMATGTLRNAHLDSVVPHLSQPPDSSVAATIGSGPSSVRSESIKENVFHIYPTGESDTDRLITQALVLGDFSSAVNLCLASERYADALLLAVRGGDDLLQSTQKAYFNRRTLAHPFLRVFQSIVTEDLTDIVQNADLAEWKAVFVVLCTYAKETEFANLADQLGRRLQFKWQLLTGSDAPESKAEAKAARQDATLCYLAARNLEHVVAIWINEMQEEEAATDAPRYSAHANALQSFIEKVSAFQSATGYVDKDLTANNVPVEEAAARSYALSGLYDRFYEYADLLATQGLVDVAAKYVKMTPKDYHGSDGQQLNKARSRIFTAAGIPDTGAAPATSTSTAFGRQPATAGPSSVPASGSRHKPSASISRYPPAPGLQSSPYSAASPYSSGPTQSGYSQPSINPYGAPAPVSGPSPAQAQSSPYAPPPTSGPYAPPPSSQPAGPYGPATTSAPAPVSNPYGATSGPYGPTSTYQPSGGYSSNGYGEQANVYGGSAYGAPPAPAPPLGPPPRAGEHGAKEHIIPASQRRDIPGWNDAPSTLSSSKRGSAASTPKPQAITSPFPMSDGPQPPTGVFPPPGSSATPPPRGPPGVVPPPPKGGPRPPSAAKMASPPAQTQNLYGQPAQQQPAYGAQSSFGQPPQSPPQAHAPQYAPPPKAGPPPPRGAPRAGPPPGVAGPPPRALSPLGPGNRAAQQPLGGTFSPPPVAGPPPPGARAGGPPPPGRAGPRPPSHTPTPVPESPKKPAHPAGDRSHMNDKGRRVYEALSAEFARVKQVNPNAQGTVKKVIEDTDRRLNILYDDLNNDRVPENTVDRLSQITTTIESRDAGSAMHMHTDLLTSATSDVAHWAPGIKQLIRLGLTQ